MTKEEFNQRALVIFRQPHGPVTSKALSELIDEGQLSFTKAEVAMMASAALDEAFPEVIKFRQERGMATAVQSMASIIAGGPDLFNKRHSIN